jgi:hypothetical protein
VQGQIHDVIEGLIGTDLRNPDLALMI